MDEKRRIRRAAARRRLHERRARERQEVDRLMLAVLEDMDTPLEDLNKPRGERRRLP